MREAPKPERVAEVLIRCRVVHQHDHGQLGAGQIFSEPLELGLGNSNLDVLAFERVEDDEVVAAAIDGVVEGAIVTPNAREIVTREVDCVVVAGHVDELGVGAAQDVLALAIPRQVDVAALVLDVVTEVHEEVGSLDLVHLLDNASGEVSRVVGELAELAVVEGLRAEVEVGDEADLESHGRFATWYRAHMRPVLIGAGRGSRLEHRTEEIPKTLVEVMGRPMLEWIFDALAEAGFSRKDVVFVCGYKADVLRARYPELTYVENTDWENNNILESLIYARDFLGGGFLSSYTDIIYRGSCVRDVVSASEDKVLVCDTDWRRRYVRRKNHPESDAEKMRAEGSRVIEVSRTIKSEEAAGEFIGVAKFTAQGAKELLEAYDEAKASCATLGDRPFLKAYLIHLFQRMIDRGSAFSRVDTDGGYMELDTLEDLSMAETWWNGGS